MGCDIHICTEVKETVNGKEKWINVDDWRVNKFVDEYEDEKTYILNPIYDDRNYELFSFLANVRNYYGVKSFGFKRGVPEDVSKETKEEIKWWGIDGHSHGFCTLKELKDAVEKVKVIKRQGAVTKEQAEKYRKTGEEPKSWSMGINCYIGIAKEYLDRFEWLVWDAKVNCFEKLIEAIEERKREAFWIFAKERDDLSHDGDIRIVFWFDN